MPQDERELLNEGYASFLVDGDEEQLRRRVRIIPIGEGDITEGASGERTYWDRDTLKSAVEEGLFDGADIIKGRGGTEPHFSLNEHVPPENKLGRVESWEYEEGVGPVGFAEIVDDEIADRIDLGLLDVSVDMLRILGDYDDREEAFRVDEIIAVPRVTVLDRGASRSASIEPAAAEALGLNSDVMDSETSFDQIPDMDPDEKEDFLGRMKRMLDSYFGNPHDRDNEVYIDPNENIQRGDTSGDDDIAESEADKQNENEDMTEDKVNELQKKLTEKESEVSDLEDQVESLNEEIDDLESDKSDTEEEIEQLSATIEDKDGQIEDLTELVRPLEEMLAEIVAEDSAMLSAESVAEKYELPELVDLLAESTDGDDDQSFSEKVKEQLAGNVKPRGDANAQSTEMTEAEREEAENMATSAMTARDLQQADKSGMSSVEYLKEAKGVDPLECDNESQLRQRIAAVKQGE